MAAIQDFLTPQGVVANYHKLVRADFDEFTQSVEVTFAIYGSKVLRDAGGTPLWHQRLKFNFADFLVDPRRAIYDVVTKRPDGYLAGAGVDDDLPEVVPGLELKPPQDPEQPNAPSSPEGTPEPA